MTSNDHATKSAEASPADDPFATFAAWYSEAQKSEPNDANAMSLATVDGAGLPNVRMVLLKDVDDAGAPNRGFVFYTNFEGVKGREVLANPKVALGFHWKSLRRQIRIRGTVTVVADDEADAYFASRARLSRIGAWASQQSRPLESKFALEAQVAKYTAKFGVGEIPRPSYWSGFRVTPLEIEFWSDGAFRLHDRLVFRRSEPGQSWSTTRLYP
ncbi:MAG: pyridoxamine 5'-phosphate oxidase [Hyphomicrobium sp.]|nr:pyridoxamine 5'-phosphate oxidase [Hyphomicrobium sp.]